MLRDDQGPSGSHLRQHGGRPSAETTGPRLPGTGCCAPGPESFGSAALLFLAAAKPWIQTWGHDVSLDATGGVEFDSGIWDPLFQGTTVGNSLTHPSHVEEADGRTQLPTSTLALRSKTLAQLGWGLLSLFCFKKLAAKSRECRGREIAPNWVLCPDSASAALTLHDPFGLYSKLLSPASSHGHPCPSWILRRLKKTRCVRTIWTLRTLQRHKVLLSTVIRMECPSPKRTLTLILTHYLQWKTPY